MYAKIIKGNTWGAFDLDFYGNRIYAHPGENSPTQAILEIDKNVNFIEFRSINNQCNIDDMIKINIKNIDNNMTLYLPKGQSKIVLLDSFSDRNLKIVISKINSSACDSVSILFH